MVNYAISLELRDCGFLMPRPAHYSPIELALQTGSCVTTWILRPRDARRGKERKEAKEVRKVREGSRGD